MAAKDKNILQRPGSSSRPLGALVVVAALTLAGCGTGQVSGGASSGTSPSTTPPLPPSPPTPPPAFTVDADWSANPDNPDGYLVYIGPNAASTTTLARTLAKGASDWNPGSPATSLPADVVLAAVGNASQVCVAIRAFNAGGVSSPSEATCAALP